MSRRRKGLEPVTGGLQAVLQGFRLAVQTLKALREPGGHEIKECLLHDAQIELVSTRPEERHLLQLKEFVLAQIVEDEGVEVLALDVGPARRSLRPSTVLALHPILAKQIQDIGRQIINSCSRVKVLQQWCQILLSRWFANTLDVEFVQPEELVFIEKKEFSRVVHSSEPLIRNVISNAAGTVGFVRMPPSTHSRAGCKMSFIVVSPLSVVQGCIGLACPWFPPTPCGASVPAARPCAVAYRPYTIDATIFVPTTVFRQRKGAGPEH